MATKITAPLVMQMKAEARPVVCITAYDATGGAICDAAGVDLVLVGDSLGNVILGHPTTVPVTMDDMVHHTRATRKGVKNAMLVADLPFGSYQSSVAQGVENAVTLMQAGAEGVKLEGDYPEVISAIHKAGIPIMGHVGFTPQSVNTFGGFRVQGRGDQATEIAAQAKRIQDAGAFAIVLELMPVDVAKMISESLNVPTIGIGAGVGCDGQIQVFHDVVGLAPKVYRHAKKYADGRVDFVTGLRRYTEEVRQRQFPTDEQSF